MLIVIKNFFFCLAFVFFYFCPIQAFYCYFIPPKEWQLAAPEHLSPSVEVGFIGKSKKNFSPSLNLASEPVNVSLAEYVKIVKKLHESDRNNRWRELGKFSSAAGEGLLTEIDTRTEVGPIRLLQFIMIKEGKAYVLTAGALKEEFANYYEEFEKTFSSLTFASDLFAGIKNVKLKEKLEEKLKDLKTTWNTMEKKGTFEERFNDKKFQKDHWIPLQNFLTKDFTEIGAHWQILMLKHIREELQSSYES